jgi:hypothetical protein
MKSLKTDAVVELTEEARAQSYDRNKIYQDKIDYINAITARMNDLREWALGDK